MASNKEVVIEQVCDDREHENSSTEQLPLINKSPRVGGILKTLKRSIFIKSKAANILLIWNAILSTGMGQLLNPAVLISISSEFLGRNNTSLLGFVGAIAYAITAFLLLFFPLAGYLADTRYRRYKVVSCGLHTILVSVYLTLFSLPLTAIFLPIILSTPYFGPESQYSIVISNIYLTSLGVLGFICYVLFIIGYTAFEANVIQFGVDQLADLPTRESFLFISWFVLTKFLGPGLTIVFVAPNIIYLLYVLAGCFFVLFFICLPISVCATNRNWFVRHEEKGNPYKEIKSVVGFSRKHQVPLRRSAFTYWEDEIPRGLELGKSKYGGPFTTEQVENVKSFFGILLIILSLGPYFMTKLAAEDLLSILGRHMELPANYWAYFYEQFSAPDVLIKSNYLLTALLVPVYLKLVHPLLERYMPSTLKKIGVGLALITISLICSLLMDSIGHALPGGQETRSMFAITSFDFNITTDSLHMTPYLLTTQNLLVAVAHILVYTGLYEFICAQSPHSMKGFLIGIAFATEGFFKLFGVAVLYLPFAFTNWGNPIAGKVFFLANIVVSVVGLVLFACAARRYRRRQREEVCNIQKHIEEFYDNVVNHNKI